MASRRRTQRRNYQRSNQAVSLGWVWLLTGMLVGVLAATFIYMSSSSMGTLESLKQLARQKVTPGSSNPSSEKKGEKTPIAKKKSPQHFEFYDILPDQAVELPETIVKPKTAPTLEGIGQVLPPKTKSKLAAATYLVQAGIFKDPRQADELKATLALQGFSPQIQTLRTQDGQIRFRVFMGPYPSEAKALLHKKSLEESSIHGTMIMLEHPEK